MKKLIVFLTIILFPVLLFGQFRNPGQTMVVQDSTMGDKTLGKLRTHKEDSTLWMGLGGRVNQVVTSGDNVLVVSATNGKFDTLSAVSTDSIFINDDLVALQNVLFVQSSGDVFYLTNLSGDTIITMNANDSSIVIASTAETAYFSPDSLYINGELVKKLAGETIVSNLIANQYGANTIIVGQDGEYTYNDIDAAVNVASAHSTILVMPGTYTGHIDADVENITIKSLAGAENTILVLTMSANSGIEVNADSIIIDGFRLRGDAAGSLIEIQASGNNATIRNCVFESIGSPTFGATITTSGADNILFEYNTFLADAGDGCFWGNKTNTNLKFFYNTFIGQDSTTGYAIQTGGFSNVLVKGNIIRRDETGNGGFASGIFFHTAVSGPAASDSVMILNNYISDCSKGIRIGHTSQTADIDYIWINYNEIFKNSYGIYISSDANNLPATFEIVNNNIHDNAVDDISQNHSTAVGTAFNIQDNRVAAGVTNPAEKMHINGGEGTALRISSTGNTSELQLWQTGLANANARNWGMFINKTNWGDLQFLTSVDNATEPATKLVTFSRTGQVGIGASTPEHLLDVYGKGNLALVGVDPGTDSTIIDSVSMTIIDASSNKAYIHPDSISFNGDFVKRTDGNIGIGTTHPSSALHILNATGPQLIITDTNGADSTTFEVDGSGDLTVVPSGGDIILSSGNLGIRATVPDHILDITGQGDIAIVGVDAADSLVADSLKIVSIDASSNKLYLAPDTVSLNGDFVKETDGKIGIGTTSPSTLLDVAGSSTFGSTTADAMTLNGTITSNQTYSTASTPFYFRTSLTATSGEHNNLRARAQNEATGASTSDIRGVYGQAVTSESKYGGTNTGVFGNAIAKNLSTTVTNRGGFFEAETEATPTALTDNIGVHIRTKMHIDPSSLAYGLYIENEKMATGFLNDAYIALKSTTWGAAESSALYGIDMSGITELSTGDLQLHHGAVFNNNSVDLLTITEAYTNIAGNLGINNSAPDHYLDIGGKGNFAITGVDVGSDSTVIDSNTVTIIDASSNKAYISPDTVSFNGDFVKETNGYIGIGTTSPAYLLDVRGNIGIGNPAVGDHDALIYFRDDGSPQYFGWNDGISSFDFSTDVLMRGTAICYSSNILSQSTSPFATLYNTSTEDTDGGRESYLRFYGVRSGSEAVDQVRIYGEHDGASDNDNSRLRVQVNNGSGLQNAMEINALGQVSYGVTGEVKNFNTPKVYNDSTVAGETTLTTVQPQGYVIDHILVKNTTANQITNLDFGYTDGGGEIVAAANFLASDEASLTILQRINDFDAAQTIYISAGDWNSANLIIYIKFSQVF